LLPAARKDKLLLLPLAPPTTHAMQIGKLETHSANAALNQNTIAVLMLQIMREQTLMVLKLNTALLPRSTHQPSLQVVLSQSYRLMQAHAQMNAYNIQPDHLQAATAAQTLAKNVRMATFFARTAKLMLQNSPLIVLRLSHCAANSALLRMSLSYKVLIVTAAQWLVTNAIPSTKVDSAPMVNLIRPKFLMAAQQRTFSSKNAKIHRMLM